MSTQDPEIGYGTTGERLKAFALNDATRDRVSVLATRYWEIATYAFLLLSAGILRFYNLGARAYHHDESLHGYFSFGFTEGLRQAFTFGSNNHDTYKHVPFMHGPFQFIGNGFMMWIFQDGDWQGRLLAAIMGTSLVAMPFLLRKQLGTFGAIAAAAFITFSPTLTYYSRFTREDIYTAFWTFGIVIFIWRYIATQENKFLYLAAGFMAGAFCTKETTFMTAGAFLLFLDYMLAMHIANAVRKKESLPTARYVALTLALIPVAWLIAIAWPFIESTREKYELDELPAEGVLLIVLGTLAAPMYAAAIQMLPSRLGFGAEWQNRPGETGDLHVHDAERRVAYTTVFFLIGAASAIGLSWRPKIWIFAAGAFWVPFVLLYTTFLTNPEGFMSGMWGSMDYWISQQDVARGSQPEYYYFITIPVYEFLPLALSLAAMVYYGVRGNLSRAMVIGGVALAVLLLLALPADALDRIGIGRTDIAKAGILHVWLPFGIVLITVMVLPMDHFTRFLIFWLIVTSLSLTVASEKMPWLNVHIALALAVLAGKFVGDVIAATDLRDDLPGLERLAPFAYAAAASFLSILVFTIVGPLALASFGAWALAIVAGIAVYWAFSGYSARTGVQVALVGFVAAFMMFTLRAGVLASWGHPDNPYAQGNPPLATRDYGEVPTELLVYTQSSGDIPGLKDQILQIARDNGRGLDQPVFVDSTDGFTWPWAWYLRDFRSVTFSGVSDGYRPKPGEILLISKSSVGKVDLGGLYDPGIQYHHRRWFPEEYKGGADGHYTTHDFFGDIVSRSTLGTWLDFWVRRTLPADEPGTVDSVAYFPKGSGIVQDTPVGPTFRSEGSQLVIGSSGYNKGQLTTPADVAVDAQGNIYVADTDNQRIQKFDASGNFVAELGGFSATDYTLNQPWSVAVAPDGTIFVADTWTHRIMRFGSDLKKQKEWGGGGQVEPGGDPFKLFGPREITVTASGNVLVSDTGNARIIEYTADGDFVRQVGGKTAAGEPTLVNEPVGIVTNAAGDVYIADFWNKRILVLDSELKEKQTIAVDAWGSEAVTERAYLALLDDGRILATDPTNGKILTFAADGTARGAYDVPKEGQQPNSRPIGIAVDGDSVIVDDSLGNVVRKIPLGEVAK